MHQRLARTSGELDQSSAARPGLETWTARRFGYCCCAAGPVRYTAALLCGKILENNMRLLCGTAKIRHQKPVFKRLLKEKCENLLNFATAAVRQLPAVLEMRAAAVLPHSIPAVPHSTYGQIPVSSQDPSIVVRGISGTSVTLNSIRGSDGGEYVCSDGTSPPASFFVNVWDNESLIPVNVVTNGTDVHVYLNCHQRFAFNFPLIWTRKVGDVTYVLNDHPADDRNYTIAGDGYGYQLHILNHDYKRYPLKTGQYQCQLNTSGHNIPAGLASIQQTVTYQATPDVRIDGERSATTASPFTATCVYSGAASDRVRWIFTNDSGEHGTTGRIVLVDYDDDLVSCPNAAGTEDPDRKCVAQNARISLTRNRNFENASTAHEHTSVLHISNTTLEDRGTYECFVRSDHGESNANTYLRIKDKYAALWPAIGVLAEIILLLLIIFICERRRSRVEEEEEVLQPLNANVENNRDAEPAVAVRNRK